MSELWRSDLPLHRQMQILPSDAATRAPNPGALVSCPILLRMTSPKDGGWPSLFRHENTGFFCDSRVSRVSLTFEEMSVIFMCTHIKCSGRGYGD